MELMDLLYDTDNDRQSRILIFSEIFFIHNLSMLNKILIGKKNERKTTEPVDLNSQQVSYNYPVSRN